MSKKGSLHYAHALVDVYGITLKLAFDPYMRQPGSHVTLTVCLCTYDCFYPKQRGGAQGTYSGKKEKALLTWHGLGVFTNAPLLLDHHLR